MNKAHRSLWNSSLGAWVAVSENTHARGKKSHRAVARAAGAASLLMLAGASFAGGDGGGGGFLVNGSYGAGYAAGSSTTGEGGHGGQGDQSAAGAAGGALGANGTNGAAASSGNNPDRLDGSGGGGGGSARTGSAPVTTSIKAGNGGNGGTGGYAGSIDPGGAGGGGGGGSVLATQSFEVKTTGALLGGDGGNGGDAFTGTSSLKGTGGGGGAGVLVVPVGGVTITNAGSIAGGNGGKGLAAGGTHPIANVTVYGGAGGNGEGGAQGGTQLGAYAQGGAGIVGSNLTIVNSGTISGGLAGDGVTRANSLQLGASNNSLTLQAGSVLNGGVVAQGTGNTLRLEGTNIEDDAFQGFSRIHAASGSNWRLAGTFLPAGNLAITVDGSGATPAQLAMNGVISGPGSLTVDGGGTLALGGPNAYAGGTTIKTGTTAQIGTAGALGTGTVTLDGGKLAVTSSLRLTNRLSFAGGQRSTVAAASGQVFGIGGDLHLDGGATAVFGSVTENGTIRVGGGAGGSLSSDAAIVVAGGTLQAADVFFLGFFLSNVASTTADTGATLDLNGSNVTLRNLQGAGTLNTRTGNGPTQTTTVESGAFSGAITGTGQLVKTTAGTLTLTGASTYTGGTTISAGTLQIGDGGSLMGNVVNNGTLAFDRTDSSTFSGAISGSGDVTKWGTGAVTLSGNNTYQGGTTVRGGTLRSGAASALSQNTAYTVLGGVLDLGSFNLRASSLSGTAGTVQLGSATLTVGSANASTTFAGSIDGTGSLVKEGSGTLTLSGSNTYTGGTTVSAGTLQIGSGGNNGSITGDVTNHAALVFNRANGIAFAGNISGVGNVTKTGAGTLVYTGSATHAGGTTIDGGTLQIGNGGTVGSITGNVSNNAALVFNRSNDAAFAGNITGSGNVTKTGAGTLVYTGNASHTGGTTIDSGTLEIRDSGSILGSIANNAALVFNRSADTTFAGNISGTGSLLQKGARKLTLTGDNTFTGTITVVVGNILQIGAGGTTGIITGNISNDGDLVFDRADGLSYAGVISGTGTLSKNGVGVLELTGASTYSGATEVNAGTLRVNNTTDSATGASTVLVKSGATLSGGGTIAGQVTIANGATLAPGSNLGTLTTGMLRFDPGAFLNYELGQAGVAGGPLNDLVKVNGGLVLDGTLNVAEAPGGTFGPGLYRLIRYSGSLIDNGLNIGTAPAGTAAGDLHVQSSALGEINLINSKGVSLSFWDGAGGDATQYNDGKIGGGSGTWRIGRSGLNDPSDSWTDANGKTNTGWQQNQFALFGGAAGTVRVDNTGGAISIDGAQFSTSGYVVTGDALTLGNASTVIKVGDGTASGAQMQATIASVLSGAGGLTKDDLGTLILKGANTYTGGTLVRAGTLQGDTTSLRGAIVNDARVVFDQVASGSFAGTMSGAGSLRKSGVGELLVTATNSYKGGTQVDGGTLNVGVTGAVGTGPVGVSSGAALIFSGSADAESLKITAGAAQSGNGGFVQFQDNASAGHATLTAHAGGSIDFRGNATAGNATIENRGGEVMVWFNANAGKTHITNFAGGTTYLWGGASAEQATIVNERDGVLDIRDNATAAQASVVNKAGGTVFLSNLGTPGITIGSLEGAGRVLLGAKSLTTGALNTDTEISGVISGVGGSLVKVGTGALTLSGENTHTGGTALRQGRLNVGHSQALGTGTLSMDDDTTLGFSANGLTIANTIKLTGNNDPVIDTGAFSGTLSGAINGGGFITKQGTGTLTLSGANTYTGATNVAQGTLKAGAVNTLSAASAHSVATGATLDLAGFNQTVASLANSGTVSLAGATAGTTLTVKGAYVGSNGVLKLSTTLNGTGPSDRLVLDGPTAVASGKTTVQISNLGGLGALTSGNGIEVVTAQNGATTTAQTTKDAFSLAGGHVDAGAYEYRLHAADASGAGENWYLRSTTDAVAPGQPVGLPVVTYRPEAALYAALPSQLRQGNLAMLGDVRKRVGDDDVKGAASTPTGSDRRAWARVLSTDIDIQQGGTVSPTSKGRLTGFQAGTDLLATPNWRAGLYVGQLDGDARVSGFASGIRNLAVGRNDLRSQYVGVYGTYTADSGFYADAVVQSGRHRYTVEPMLGAGVGGKGHSLLGSIEVGQAFAIGDGGWRIEPQLQLIHHHMDLGNAAIAGAIAQPQADSGWIARAGVRVKGQLDTALGVLQPYGRVNVYKTSSGTDIARFVNGATTTDIVAPTSGTSTELAGGFTLALSQATSLYGEVGKLWSSGGDAKVKSAINGSLGVRVKW
ncbi:outer membrane autotransporter protein [Variovorax boronicumulans]|uniref:autotransporter-associated beta strand repeat-containing protein n=1 Tax=Variovorax boronicumulans TaxID=436515 RepID=UPI00339B54B0